MADDVIDYYLVRQSFLSACSGFKSPSVGHDVSSLVAQRIQHRGHRAKVFEFLVPNPNFHMGLNLRRATVVREVCSSDPPFPNQISQESEDGVAQNVDTAQT